MLRVDCKCLKADFVGLWVSMCVGWGLFCADVGVLGVDCECLWADFLSMMSDCGLIGGDGEVLGVDCNCLEADFVVLWVNMCVGWELFCVDGGLRVPLQNQKFQQRFPSP